MKNFEVQHTIRLYDPELIAKIGRAYEIFGKNYRNKNEFMTELLRLGVNAMLTPPASPASSAVPSAVFCEIDERLEEVLEFSEEISKYLTAQYKKIDAHLTVVERLLSSLYHAKVGELKGTPPSPRKMDDGFYDDIPIRFDKILITLEPQRAAA